MLRHRAKGTLVFAQPQIDLLLSAVDILTRFSQTPKAEMEQWNDAPEIGRDGASGLKLLHAMPALTPSRRMPPRPLFLPKAAAEISAAAEVLPLKKITDALLGASASARRLDLQQ